MTEGVAQIGPAPQKDTWISLPTLNSSDEDIRQWINRHMNIMSHRRRYHTQRAALNLWFYLGRQWIEARSELASGNGVYHFTEIHRNSMAAFPRPVTNIIAPAVDNEVARLGRKEFVPDAQPGKNKPEWMQAARLATDILQWEMGKSLWSQKRDDLGFNLLIDAVTIMRTWWDENETELSLISSGETATCPGCGAKFASREVPRGFSTLAMPTPEGPREMRHKDTLRDVEQTDGEATAMHPKGINMVEIQVCPFCEEVHQLETYPLNEKEAQEPDAFGRQLGMFVPTGETAVEAVSLHEYFPENGGINVEPHEQKINQQTAVRTLEYIALRYPEFADKLRPEEPRELIRYNPIYSEPLLSGYMGYNLSTGYESYYNHAKLQEIVIQPHPHIPGLEEGAIFASAGEQVSRKPLMVTIQGKEGPHKIAKVKYHFARFKRWPKNFWSRTVVDELVPIQRRLNELDAQMIDIRERGKPNMWLPEGTTLYTRDDVQGSFTCIYYDPADPSWTPQQGLYPGQAIAGSPYMSEREMILRDAQMVGAPQDIEVGQAPGSVKTTSGLMLLDEAAAQKRGPRERSLTTMFESGFEHLLEMNWAFRKEDVTYSIQREGGIYENKSYTGTDLVGVMRVKMTAKGGHDQAIYNKEAAAEALQLVDSQGNGLISLSSPDTVDRLLELMKLPKDLNERDHFQVMRAEEAWSDFIHEELIHTPDPTIEHPIVWYSVLAKRWFSDEAVILQRTSGWLDVIPLLTKWEDRKGEIELLEISQKPIYGNAPPDQWGSIYQQGSEMVQAAMDDFKTASESHAQAMNSAPPGAQESGVMPEPPMEPMMTKFPKPPEGGWLPEAENLKIFEVWMRMLPSLRPAMTKADSAKANGQRLPPATERLLNLKLLLEMRAVIESYRIAVLKAAAGPPPSPGAVGAPPPNAGAAGG